MQEPKLVILNDHCTLIKYDCGTVYRIDAKLLTNKWHQIKVRRIIPYDQFKCLYRTQVFGAWSEVFLEIVRVLQSTNSPPNTLVEFTYYFGGHVPGIPPKPVRYPSHSLN